jgi:hypothetical protein
MLFVRWTKSAKGHLAATWVAAREPRIAEGVIATILPANAPAKIRRGDRGRLRNAA